jgi:hypothetical protein
MHADLAMESCDFGCGSFFSGFKVSKFQGSKDDFGTSHFFSADAGGFRGFSWRAATFVEQSGLSGRSFLTGH